MGMPRKCSMALQQYVESKGSWFVGADRLERSVNSDGRPRRKEGNWWPVYRGTKCLGQLRRLTVEALIRRGAIVKSVLAIETHLRTEVIYLGEHNEMMPTTNFNTQIVDSNK